MGADTTTEDVLEGIDLSGQTALVTGASAGLGVETVRALAGAGARVLGAVRDVAKAERVLHGVEVELLSCDLADLTSVRAAAAQVRERVPALQMLINNAGVMAPPLLRTAQGFELQLGTNHLGHFLLTELLLPVLQAGAPARIVNVSSRGHLRSGLRWEDPHYRTSDYDKWQAYGQSKTANILFTVELERRFGQDGVHAFALHPGVIRTELSRHLSAGDMTALSSRVPGGNLVFKDVAAGAATTVWAATSPELDERGGCYLEDCRVADPSPGDGNTGFAAYAVDPAEAARLWTWSQEQIASVS